MAPPSQTARVGVSRRYRRSSHYGKFAPPVRVALSWTALPGQRQSPRFRFALRATSRGARTVPDAIPKPRRAFGLGGPDPIAPDGRL